MADLGYVKRLLAGIPDEKTRSILMQFAEYTYGNLRFGAPEHQSRATNFQAYFERGMTPATTSEFSIAHGLNSVPGYAILLLPLDTPGAKAGFLTVSRPADSKRIYLRADAGSTSVPFAVLIE